jgi:hypothetical protein
MARFGAGSDVRDEARLGAGPQRHLGTAGVRSRSEERLGTQASEVDDRRIRCRMVAMYGDEHRVGQQLTSLVRRVERARQQVVLVRDGDIDLAAQHRRQALLGLHLHQLRLDVRRLRRQRRPHARKESGRGRGEGGDGDPADDLLPKTGDLGVAPSAIGFLTWAYAVARLDISQATASLYLVPAVAVAVAFVWLGERPTALELVGGAVALLGVALANTTRRRRSTDHAQTSRPRRRATATASVRPAASSLARMLETWTLTVLALMKSCWAISRLLRPSATSVRTSFSRAVSGSSRREAGVRDVGAPGPARVRSSASKD